MRLQAALRAVPVFVAHLSAPALRAPVETLATFFAMGGYAAYVWPALALTALVLAGVLFASLRAMRRNEAEVARLERQVRESRDET
jgi:heme exporter protein D